MEDLKKSVRELEKKLDDNATKIIENMKKLHNHEEQINSNSYKIQQNSLALDILKDSKNQTKKLFVIWIITFIALIGLTCYMVYVLNNMDYINEDTIEIQDVETIDNSHIKIGDDLWEKSK